MPLAEDTCSCELSSHQSLRLLLYELCFSSGTGGFKTCWKSDAYQGFCEITRLC